MRNGYEGNTGIEDTYRTLYHGMTAKDPDILDRVMSDDCIVIHMTGLRQSKDAFIGSVMDGTLNYYSVENEEICVFAEGDTATLTGRSKVNAAVYGGGRHVWRLQLEMFLELMGAEWKIMEIRASTYRKEGIEMAKNLIIYYSRKGENYWNGGIKNIPKGNTEIAAEFIQNAIGGDLFEIETMKEYAKDYYQCIDEADTEMKNGERPELKRYLDSVDGYDNIFVCGPCWWGDYPMAVYSLLDRLDLDDKRIFTLMTHEGSGLCDSKLRRAYNGADFGSGLSIHGADTAKSESKVASWAKSSVQ